MQPNAEMIIRVMGRITDETLNMDSWAKSPLEGFTCGTTMCLAGHTVVENGHPIAWFQEADGTWEGSMTTTGYDIEGLAAELLGLDDDQLTELFYETGAETVDELWLAVTKHTGVERPEAP